MLRSTSRTLQESVKHRQTELNKEDVEEVEDEEYGVRKTVKKLDPREASKGERERGAREASLAFSQLVPTLRERARQGGSLQREHEVAEVHLDFMFMGEKARTGRWWCWW